MNEKPGSPPHVAALIVAAGKGLRVGGPLPKQYREIDGESVLQRTLKAFSQHPEIQQVLPVIGPEDLPLYNEYVGALDGVDTPATGGNTRQQSVRNGLETLAKAGQAPEIVLVHDGARPFISPELIERVVEACLQGAAGVIPATPVTDTIKLVDPETDTIVKTLDRAALRAVQTPQAFQFDLLLNAHRTLAEESMTDDAALLEAMNITVVTVAGDTENMKITHSQDLEQQDSSPPIRLPRVGNGFDVHRFEPGDHVMLCGVRIPHNRSLAGHSDADVGLHALTDAVLGALGQGDIGDHFPPTDPKWAGASSDRFLAHAASLVPEQGGQLVHVDVTLICERPKIGRYRAAMKARVAEILSLDESCVSVKATTTEGLGFTGRREGIAAQATATVVI